MPDFNTIIQPTAEKEDLRAWKNEMTQRIDLWEATQIETTHTFMMSELEQITELEPEIIIEQTEDIQTAMAWAKNNDDRNALLMSENQFFYVYKGSATPIIVSEKNLTIIKNLVVNNDKFSIDLYKIIIPLLTENSNKAPIQFIASYFKKTLEVYYDTLSLNIGLKLFETQIVEKLKLNTPVASDYLTNVIPSIVRLITYDLFALLDDPSTPYEDIFRQLYDLHQDNDYLAQLSRCIRFPTVTKSTLDAVFSLEIEGIFLTKGTCIFDNMALTQHKDTMALYYITPGKHVAQQGISFDNARDAMKNVLLNFSPEGIKSRARTARQYATDTRATIKKLDSRYATETIVLNLSDREIHLPTIILQVITGSIFSQEADKKLHKSATREDLLGALLPMVRRNIFQQHQGTLLFNRNLFNIVDDLDNEAIWQRLDFRKMNPRKLQELAPMDPVTLQGLTHAQQSDAHIALSLLALAPLSETFDFNQRVDAYNQFYNAYKTDENEPILRQDLITLIYAEGGELEKELDYLKRCIPSQKILPEERVYAKSIYYEAQAVKLKLDRKAAEERLLDAETQTTRVKATTQWGNAFKFVFIKKSLEQEIAILSNENAALRNQNIELLSENTILKNENQDLVEQNKTLDEVTNTQAKSLERWQSLDPKNNQSLETDYHNLQATYKTQTLYFEAAQDQLNIAQKELTELRNRLPFLPLNQEADPNDQSINAYITDPNTSSFFDISTPSVSPISKINNSSILNDESNTQEQLNILRLENSELNKKIILLESRLAQTTRSGIQPEKESLLEPTNPNDDSNLKQKSKHNTDSANLSHNTAVFLEHFKDVTNSTGVNRIKEKILGLQYSTLNEFADDLIEVSSQRQGITTSLWTFFGLTAGRHEKVTALYQAFANQKEPPLEVFEKYAKTIDKTPSIEAII